VEKFIYNENDWNGVTFQFGDTHEPAEVGIELVAMRTLPHVRTNKQPSMGIVLHRTNFEECSTDINRDGTVNIRRLVGLEDDTEIHKSPLTLLKKQEKIEDELTLCPMDVKGFILK
jgi:alpha-mannosidase II